MKPILYVDLDGVLADFRGAIDSKFGPDTSEHRVITGGEWKQLRITWPTFWADLGYEDFALDLWRVVAKYRPSILSAIPDGWPSAAVGKKIWVRRSLPKFGYHPSQQVHTVRRVEKQQYAKQQDGTANILIDDMGKNIREWDAAGGIGIHYIPSRAGISRVAKTLATHMD